MRIQYKFFFLFSKFPKVCCTSKIKHASLTHKRETSFAKVNCITTVFAGKSLVTQFCKVGNYGLHNNFFSKKCFSSSYCLTLLYFQSGDYSSTVQQSLVIQKLNADLQLQTYLAIKHSYYINADYSPHSDCSTTQPGSSFQNSILMK